MKKITGMILSALLIFGSTIGATASEKVNEVSVEAESAQLISRDVVTIPSTDIRNRSGQNQEFTIYTFYENGVTMRALGFIEDMELSQVATDYITQLGYSTPTDIQQSPLLEDSTPDIQLSPFIVSGSRNIQGFDGSSMQLGSIINSHNNQDWRTFHRFSGSQTVSWNGGTRASEIFLRQRADFRAPGFSITIGWPPEFSIFAGGDTREWQSNILRNSNTMNASIGNVTSCTFCVSVTWTVEGEILVGNSVFRPGAAVTFGAF